MSKKIKAGDTIPAFELPDENGQTVRIEDFRGKPLVIYFYPKDDTPGCTKEACSFRDQFGDFTDEGVVVFGISADSPADHMAFKRKYSLPFSLLSDQSNAVRKLFGVPGDLFGLIPGRVTYIVDAEGVVRHVFNSQINAAKHVSESLKFIRGMKASA